MNELNQNQLNLDNLNPPVPGESEKAFHAYRSYLALGVDRSLAALARQLDCNESLLERWSKQWNWSGRIQAYTQRLAQIQDTATAEAIQDAADKWVRRGEQLKELEWNITLRLLERAAELLQTPDSTRDACLAVDLASRIGRLSSELTKRESEPPPPRNEIPSLFATTLYKIYGAPNPNPSLPPAPTLALGSPTLKTDH